MVSTVANVEHLLHNSTISAYHIMSPAVNTHKPLLFFFLKKPFLSGVMPSHIHATKQRETSLKQPRGWSSEEIIDILFLWKSTEVRQQAHVLQSWRRILSTKQPQIQMSFLSMCVYKSALVKTRLPGLFVAVNKMHIGGTCCCACRVLKFCIRLKWSEEWQLNVGVWVNDQHLYRQKPSIPVLKENW